MKSKLFLFLLIIPCFIYAQDILITDDGENIKAWDVDISSKKVYYKTAAGKEAPVKSIAKEKVLLLKKADGTKVRINHDSDALDKDSAPQNVNKHPNITPVPDASDAEANKKSILKFNTSDIIMDKKQKNSKASWLLGIFHMSPESKVTDKNVEISYKSHIEDISGLWLGYRNEIGISVHNKTDKTIYIYLGNTFFMRHGVSKALTYSSAAQSTAGGNDGSRTTGFSQGVLAVPANSTVDLGQYELFPIEGQNPFPLNIVFIGKEAYLNLLPLEQYVKKYESRELNPSDTTIDIGFKLTYSFSEDNTQLYHLDSNLYLSKLIGYSGYLPEKYKTVVGVPVFFKIRQMPY